MTNHRRRMQTRTRLKSGSRFVEPFDPRLHNQWIALRKAHRRFQRRRLLTIRTVRRNMGILAKAFGTTAAQIAATHDWRGHHPTVEIVDEFRGAQR